MRKLLQSLTSFVLALLVTAACVDHHLESTISVECDGAETVSYSDHIMPIVEENCSRCHNSSFVGRNWTDPVQLQEHAGEAARRVQLPTTHPDHMPQAPPELTLEEIKSIVCWAEQGAPIDN
jgi:uncharacterized membrane protein